MTSVKLVGQVNESDRRVKRTHKLLQDAFLSLIAEKGFHAISVQDIAERADVNRATFYAHFVDKYALLDHVVGEVIRQELAKRISIELPFTLANLHALAVTVLEALAQFNGHCKPTDRELDPLVEARVQLELETFLLEWLGRAASVETEPRPSRGAAAKVLSWAIFGAGIDWSRGTREVSADETARELLSLLSGGIGRMLKVPVRISRNSDLAVREVVPQR